MNDELREKIGVVAGMLVQEAMTTGLTWEEIVAALGLAAKATAGCSECGRGAGI